MPHDSSIMLRLGMVAEPDELPGLMDALRGARAEYKMRSGGITTGDPDGSSLSAFIGYLVGVELRETEHCPTALTELVRNVDAIGFAFAGHRKFSDRYFFVNACFQILEFPDLIPSRANFKKIIQRNGYLSPP